MIPVSAMMCVYKREKFLAEAIESILDQTFSDFEFVIVVDGATDGVLKIVNSYANKDARIKLVINKENTGVARATATGLAHCTGKYIAMMDSDDISLPDRFQTQYDYLEAHPGIDALGSGFDFMDEDGHKTSKFLIRPSDPMLIRFQMFYHCMLHNPTVMARTIYFKQFNEGHSEESLDSAQDYAFWLRTNFDHFYSNLPDRLLLYRLHSSQMSITASNQQRTKSLVSAHLAFEKLLGKPIEKEVVNAFYFSSRLTVEDAGLVRQGLQVMFLAQKAFERSNSLTRQQIRETRTFSYEKIKSYALKYKNMRGVLLIGMMNLMRLLPARIFLDGFIKLKKQTGHVDRSDETNEIFLQ